jgi:hypothetical protein
VFINILKSFTRERDIATTETSSNFTTIDLELNKIKGVALNMALKTN